MKKIIKKKKVKKILFIKVVVVIGILLFLFSCVHKSYENMVNNNVTVRMDDNQNVDVIEKLPIVEVDEKTGFSVVRYGKYEQKMDRSYDIDWFIVAENEKSYLLVSRYVIDCKNFNDKKTKVSYEESSIRKWLNDTFIKTAFTSNEIKHMGSLNSFGCNLIKSDLASLLNVELCKKYFGKEKNNINVMLQAKATEYAIESGVEAVEKKETDVYKNTSYYLSDNADTLDKAMWVGIYGHIYKEGQGVRLEKGDGIRPIIAVRKEMFERGDGDVVPTLDDKIENDVVNVTNNANKNVSQKQDIRVNMTGSSYDNVAKMTYKSKSLTGDSVNIKNWKFGGFPVEWGEIPANFQVISNYKPNGSIHFGIKSAASSGNKGCFAPLFYSATSIGKDYDARVYIFEDYKKKNPEEMKFTNSLYDVEYRGYKIADILAKKYNIEKLSDGVITANGERVNVVYIEELDKIIDG